MKRSMICRLGLWLTFTLVLLITDSSLQAQGLPSALKPLDEQRISEIVLLLEDQPSGFGQPCTNRKVWDKLLKSGEYDLFLKNMERFSFPAFSKADYFSLSDGSATSSGRGLQMMRDRAKGLSELTWAECLQNKGRYIRQIQEGLKDILAQKSWVSPRNDFKFKNYNSIEYSVELTSALYAHTIAQTLYLLGDKLDSSLKKQAIEALQKRVFDPVLDKIRTQNDSAENRFLQMTNNYNHVCLSGVVGAALAVLEDKKQRAVFTYIGEYYSKNGLEGFGDDGYCSEGVGYYNYGFGHYILLRENIWQATKGKIDLFAIEKVKKIAGFIPGLEIINGVYPAISDSKPGVQPDASIMRYLNRNFGLGLEKYDTVSVLGNTDDNRNDVMMVFPNSSDAKPKRISAPSAPAALRYFFEKTGVLISRPTPGSICQIGVAFKGGNNKEHHNHNDVGSYTIVSGKEIMAGDPGSIPYTADIFTEKFRYTYKTIGSFGHPVPLVAGKQQQAGSQSKAVTIGKDFTTGYDDLVLDIGSAYPESGLQKLHRSMHYDRSGKGIVLVTDDFAFNKAERFESAVITRANWKKTSDSSMVLSQGKEKMLVTFSCPGNQLSVRSEEITEGGAVYSRIGLYTVKPIISGKLTVSYKPL
ncbi:heparinase II/III family protein [Dyadobacter psychrotolerans]|uniref:Heparinase n=1 Tax=Dyadobacter psychrotolerans TaxID=2541721 RepID=A0A4R5DRD4_9BACT|nr:heparinase II/III family protein [Dyadobacter psychrotolerans]TDE14854.1 hypothetical protein E0F88_16885 [Dyadobacter psychrotolerans]